MLRHEAPHAVVLHHPTHKHADFLKDLAWQEKVVSTIIQIINSQHPPHMPNTVGLMQAFRDRVRNHSKARLVNKTSSMVTNTPCASQSIMSCLLQSSFQQQTQSRQGVGAGDGDKTYGGDQDTGTLVTAADTMAKRDTAGAARRGSSPDDVTSPVTKVVHAQHGDTFCVQDISDSGPTTRSAVRRRKTVNLEAQAGRRDVESKVDVVGKQRSTSQRTQQHGHSDSASSLDSFVSRLRPKPHRITTQQE